MFKILLKIMYYVIGMTLIITVTTGWITLLGILLLSFIITTFLWEKVATGVEWYKQTLKYTKTFYKVSYPLMVILLVIVMGRSYIGSNSFQEDVTINKIEYSTSESRHGGVRHHYDMYFKLDNGEIRSCPHLKEVKIGSKVRVYYKRIGIKIRSVVCEDG